MICCSMASAAGKLRRDRFLEGALPFRCSDGRACRPTSPLQNTQRPFGRRRFLLHDLESTQMHFKKSMRYCDNPDGKTKGVRISNAAAGAHLGSTAS